MSRGSDENPVLSAYLREIRAFPLLESEEEQALLRGLLEGDPAAEARLVQSNLGFVVKIAGEYRSLGVPFEDLLNEGNLGLIEAARRYDPTHDTKFTTYAVWWVRKKILSAIADRSLVVRVPAPKRRRIYRLRRAETELYSRLGRTPTRRELAAHLSTSLKEVERLQNIGLSQASLDHAGRGEGTTPPRDLLRDRNPGAEEDLLRQEAEQLVQRAFEELTSREQAVLSWRFGLGDNNTLTLREIGDKMAISRERVRQIENEARSRIRRWLASRHRWTAQRRC